MNQYQLNCLYNGTTKMILSTVNGIGYCESATGKEYFKVVKKIAAILRRLGVTPDHPDYVIYRMVAAQVVLEVE